MGRKSKKKAAKGKACSSELKSLAIRNWDGKTLFGFKQQEIKSKLCSFNMK